MHSAILLVVVAVLQKAWSYKTDCIDTTYTGLESLGCAMSSVYYDGIGYVKYDCSDLGLTQAPCSFPSNIEIIALNNNKITVIGEHAFAHLPALKILNLANNPIEVIYANAFPNKVGNFYSEEEDITVPANNYMCEYYSCPDSCDFNLCQASACHDQCGANSVCTVPDGEDLTPKTTFECALCQPLCPKNSYCSGIDVCTCNVGYWRSNPTDFHCHPWDICTPAEYQVVNGTATTDRVCAAITVCTPGEYQSVAPTATSNAACSKTTTCPFSSQFITQERTYSSDRTCGTLTTCLPGQFEEVRNTRYSDRTCRDWTTCDFEHQYISRSGSRYLDRICSELTQCSEGIQFEKKAPTESTDRVCFPITICDADHYQSVPPTPTTDAICSPLTKCRFFEYESVSATYSVDRVCSRLTVCGVGERVLTSPTATTDRVCEKIPTYYLTGRIYDCYGQPVYRAHVSVAEQNKVTTSDFGGYYRIDGIYESEDPLTITAWKEFDGEVINHSVLVPKLLSSNDETDVTFACQTTLN